MNKIILVSSMVVLSAVMLPLAVFANSGKGGGGGKMKPSQERADKYAGYARDYDTKADRYEKKAAEASGDKADEYRRLAANFRGCAEQKRRMSKAYASGDHELLSGARKEYGRLCQERKGMSSHFKDNKNIKKSGNKGCSSGKCKSRKSKKSSCSSCSSSNTQQKKAEQIEKQIKALQQQLNEINKASKPSKDDDFAF
jgi:hypothetical protein